jgi:hypothetical protein
VKVCKGEHCITTRCTKRGKDILEFAWNHGTTWQRHLASKDEAQANKEGSEDEDSQDEQKGDEEDEDQDEPEGEQEEDEEDKAAQGYQNEEPPEMEVRPAKIKQEHWHGEGEAVQ